MQNSVPLEDSPTATVRNTRSRKMDPVQQTPGRDKISEVSLHGNNDKQLEPFLFENEQHTGESRIEADSLVDGKATDPLAETPPHILDKSTQRDSNTRKCTCEIIISEHFAAFPEELPEICIKAGSSEVGVCGKCGAPWQRLVLKPAPKYAGFEKESLEDRWRRAAEERGIDIDTAITGASITLGWERTCGCYAGAPVPATVLDPFTGRGTTGVVALRLGRNFRGCELQPKYAAMARRNIQGVQPFWVKEVSE